MGTLSDLMPVDAKDVEARLLESEKSAQGLEGNMNAAIALVQRFGKRGEPLPTYILDKAGVVLCGIAQARDKLREISDELTEHLSRET